jgi:hypothetical protein
MSEILEGHPHLANLPPTLLDSRTGTPPRRPGSVRRTSTIDMIWPGGFGEPLVLVGRARDLLTTVERSAIILDEATMEVEIGEPRTVTAIRITPERAGIEGLIGAVGGSELRKSIEEVIPGERAAATPLYLILDDISGTSLIAGFASKSSPQASGAFRNRKRESPLGLRKGKVICSGLRPHGWAHAHWSRGLSAVAATVPAGPLGLDADPESWHVFPPDPEVGMRRHRRIDVWCQNDSLEVDAFFRDSCWQPDGSQIALHEYTVAATVDATDHSLRSVEATPHVLPYPECRFAAPHADALKGYRVDSFRTEVQSRLTELRACTHLNDMLRCLAEVPALAEALKP